MAMSPYSPRQMILQSSVSAKENFHGDPRGSPGNDSDDGSSDTSDTSDEERSGLEELYSEAQEALDGLNRLAFKIRNAKQRSVPAKAISLKVVDDESGQDLFLSYAEHDHRHVEEFLRQLRLPKQVSDEDSRPLSGIEEGSRHFLVERLSDAITNRRRCFAYWHRHSLKLLRAEDQAKQPAMAPRDLETSAKLRADNAGNISGLHSHGNNDLTKGLMHTHEPQTLVSATEFSKYRRNVDDIVDIETVMSYATTAKDIDGKSADLPPPPLDAYSKSEFVCPYCRILCPSYQGRGRLWR